jgi:hypothetical protein
VGCSYLIYPISEFGPRSIVYHEGSRYIINRVLMPPREDSGAITHAAKRCGACGYIHPVVEGEGPDLCDLVFLRSLKQSPKRPAAPYSEILIVQDRQSRR